MRRENVTLALLAAALMTGQVYSEAPGFSVEVVEFVRDRRGELLEILGRTCGKVDDTPTASVLEPFRGEPNEEEIVQLLVALFRCSRCDDRNRARRWITDRVVADYLLLCVKCDKPNVADLALATLVKHVKPSYLRTRTGLLIERWGQLQNSDLLRLIGETDTVEGREFLLQLRAEGTWAPEEVWARCCDSSLRRHLIDGFLAEVDSWRKAQLAYKLGYVGAPDCVYALARSMREAGRYGKQRVSIRYDILQALQVALPDEPLFNEKLDLARTKFSEQDDGGYIDEVEKWCERSFGIEWKTDRPTGPIWGLRFIIER
jgi:hypothetical protein